MIGMVARWAGRFGFLRTLEQSRIFVHVNDIVDRAPLEPGQLVDFVPRSGPRGPHAERVRRVEALQCGKCGERLPALVCGCCGWVVGT